MSNLKNELQQIQNRFQSDAFTIREEDNSDGRTFNNVSISSDTPVERFYGTETLRHDEESIERQESIPVLWAHQRSGFTDKPGANILGRASNFSLDGTKLRADITFSDASSNDDILHKIRDKTIRDLSIGYRIEDYDETKRDDGKLDIVATKWRLSEVSVVDIPADNTIGIYRTDNDINKENDSEQNQPNQIMTKVQDNESLDKIRNDEKQRIREINSMCSKFNVDQEQRASWIDNDVSVDEVRVKILDQMGKVQDNNTIPNVALPENKREGKYTLSGAIRALYGSNDAEAGLAREISEDTRAFGGLSSSSENSIFVPFSALIGSRATYQAAGATGTGKETVATELLASDLIEALRPNSVAMNLDIMTKTGLKANYDIPKVTGTSTAYWLGTETTAITTSEATFGTVQMRPKRVGAMSVISGLMQIQSEIGIDAFINQDLLTTLAEAVDYAVFHGPGTSGSPTGVTATTGIGSVSIGTNGGDIDLDKIIDALIQVRKSKATGRVSIVTNPNVVGAMEKIRSDGSTGPYLWSTNLDTSAVEMKPGRFKGYDVYESDNIRSDLTKGSGTNLNALIVGKFSHLIFGVWGGGIELARGTVNNQFGQDLESVRALMTVDVAVRHPQAYSAILDIS